MLSNLRNPIYKDAEHKFVAATIAYAKPMTVTPPTSTYEQDGPSITSVNVLYYDEGCTKMIPNEELLAAALNGLFICNPNAGHSLAMVTGVLELAGVIAVLAYDDPTTLYLAAEIAEYAVEEM